MILQMLKAQLVGDSWKEVGDLAVVDVARAKRMLSSGDAEIFDASKEDKDRVSVAVVSNPEFKTAAKRIRKVK